MHEQFHPMVEQLNGGKAVAGKPKPYYPNILKSLNLPQLSDKAEAPKKTVGAPWGHHKHDFEHHHQAAAKPAEDPMKKEAEAKAAAEADKKKQEEEKKKKEEEEKKKKKKADQ